jgi:hypothetical protein
MVAGVSLHDDAIRPFHQGDKNRRTSELRSPLRQIAFRNPTGSGARPSRKNRHAFRHQLFQRFAERRPAHWQNRVCGRLAHQRSRFRQQKNLHFMPRFRQQQPMRKRKGRPRRILGAQALFIRIFSRFFGSSDFPKRKRNGRLASCARNVRRAIANPPPDWLARIDATLRPFSCPAKPHVLLASLFARYVCTSLVATSISIVINSDHSLR